MEYTKDNTKVIDAYKYKDIDRLVKRIMKERKEKGLPVTREFCSYKNEIKTHIRLYKLGYKIEHTKDADLEENIDKKLEKIYNIIGRFL